MNHGAVSLRLLLGSPGEVVKSLGSKQSGTRKDEIDVVTLQKAPPLTPPHRQTD